MFHTLIGVSDENMLNLSQEKWAAKVEIDLVCEELEICVPKIH